MVFFPSNFFREFPLIISIFILYYLISKKKKKNIPLKFHWIFFVNKKNYYHKSEEVAIHSKNYYRKISSLCSNDKRNRGRLHIKVRVVTNLQDHPNLGKK